MSNDNLDRRRELRALFAATFNTEHGRKALAAIHAHCGTRGDAFNAASDRQTAHNLGRQSVGRWIDQILSEENA